MDGRNRPDRHGRIGTDHTAHTAVPTDQQKRLPHNAHRTPGAPGAPGTCTMLRDAPEQAHRTANDVGGLNLPEMQFDAAA